MSIGATTQDQFTEKEFTESVVPKLDKGKYVLNVGPSRKPGEPRFRISLVKERWVNREDLEE